MANLQHFQMVGTLTASGPKSGEYNGAIPLDTHNTQHKQTIIVMSIENNSPVNSTIGKL